MRFRSKEWKSGDIFVSVFHVALLQLLKSRSNSKQFKYSSMNEWIRKMWYIHAVEYYSVLKMKEILTYTAPWTNTEVMERK